MSLRGKKLAFGSPQWAVALGLPITSGNYWFVNATGGSNGYSGEHPEAPFSTVAYALDNKVAAGDVVVPMPGHTEAIAAAAGWDVDTAAVQVAGFGWEGPTGIPTSRVPVITLGTATTADIDLDAAGVGLHNLRLKVGIDSLANMVDVNAANCILRGIIFDEPTAVLRALSYVDLAASSNEAEIAYCKNVGTGTTVTVASKNAAINVVTSHDWLMRDCWFFGNWLTGVVALATGASLRHRIRDCELNNTGSVALVSDGNQAHTGRYQRVTGSVGGASAVALATGVFDESNSLVTYIDCKASNDAKEAAAATGTAST